MKINTLHICNLDEVKNLDSYWSMVAVQDQVVLYARTINIKRYEELELQQTHIKKHYQSSGTNNAFTNLTMQKWLQLVNIANRTMTWK